MKHERFFAHVYFSNETVSEMTVSTGPMKMFHLKHETMHVCQRNVAHFVHVECRFHTKSEQIRTNLSHWNCAGSRHEITGYR